MEIQIKTNQQKNKEENKKKKPTIELRRKNSKHLKKRNLDEGKLKSSI